MFRSRGENLRATYVLLFLNVAFFLLQYQDGDKFARLFSFEKGAVMKGQIWRFFTYQFVQAGSVGLLPIPAVVTLFLNLVLLTLMGLSVEEEWGTSHFLRLYLISTLTTAVVAAYLGTPLLGSFFINFTLLFVYASLYRDQVFYLLILPVRVTLLAWLAVIALAAGVFFGSNANLAALAGSAAGYAYYLSQRRRTLSPIASKTEPPSSDDLRVQAGAKNLTRTTAMKKALSTGSISDIDRLIEMARREQIAGVNICPPADFKPEHTDRYCIRCEGFAECSARHLTIHRPVVGVTALGADGVPS
ncbi:MAG: rhomboid family intramembrane serine protease [Thermoanaerobaculia bacterium]